jgi:tetratricopeptide (TPR) repeat protein
VRYTFFVRAAAVLSGRRAAAAAVALLSAGCGPSVSVSRMVPPPYNLGPARRLVLVEVDGPSRWRSEALSFFRDAVASGGVFRLADASGAGVHLSLLGEGEAARAAKAFRREWPADVYVGLDVSDVTSRLRTKKEKVKAKDGTETERTRTWAEGTCEVELTLLDGRTGARLARYTTDETRTTPRTDSPNDRLLREAEVAAVRAAVESAVEQFTPRRVSEILPLDDEAPDAKAGIEKIEAGDLRGARLLWEATLKRAPGDARLLYNLGVVSEALGDPKAAREYYEDATRIAPDEPKYRGALESLDQRQRDAEALRTRG